MKIQVFGARGMLGSAVVRAALRRGHTIEDADIEITIVDAYDLHAKTVINCAGIVTQRNAIRSHMMLVNAVGPHRLAEACDDAGARLIHVSTDCVFTRPGPHAEGDTLDPQDDYARSKLAGEVIRAPHLTIRTSFVGVGRYGLIAQMQRERAVTASNNLLWSGHTVETVADVLITLAERGEVTGLLHLPGEFQTRWQLCMALKQRYDLPAAVLWDDTFVADRRLISHRWDMPPLPGFAAQLELMEPPSDG